MTIKRVNPHFKTFLGFWRTKFQFLVGGYGSSKSYHVALKIILKLTKERRTALVVREVYDTHRDSTFSLISELVEDMGLAHVIQVTASPMQVRFPNGSKIIFKGMDKPAKLKSINNVSLIWLEECSEIKYEGFKELLGRLRHPTLPLHMILSTNPVSKDNWSYTHFFKDEEKERFVLDDEELYEKRTIVTNNTYYHHSTADDNKFLPESYVEQLEEMKEYDYDLYRIARRGRFGINGTRVLPQFEVLPHDKVLAMMDEINVQQNFVGMDFGFEESYNAVIRMAVDVEKRWLFIYWEYYKNKQTDDETVEDLKEFIQTRERIIADSAEPKTIRYFKKMGFNMKPAKKFQGSRLSNTKKMKRFKRIICSASCKNTVREWKTLTYAKDKQGKQIDDEFNIDPHTFSAAWYGLDKYDVTDLKSNFLT